MLISRGFYSFTVLTINRYRFDKTNIHIGLPELLKILLAYIGCQANRLKDLYGGGIPIYGRYHTKVVYIEQNWYV